MQRLAMTRTEQLPLFCTFTYPDRYPNQPEVWKRDLKVMCQRMAREFPGFSGFWRLELKERQSGENVGQIAPHFHLLAWGVPWAWKSKRKRNAQLQWSAFNSMGVMEGRWLWKREVWKDGVLTDTRRTVSNTYIGQAAETYEGKNVELYESSRHDRQGRTVRTVEYWVRDERVQVDQEQRRTLGQQYEDSETELREWLSINWYEVVGSDDPRHLRAGTNVEQIRSPEGVMWYASKYVAKIDQEQAGQVGRWWGCVNPLKIPWAELQSVELSHSETVRVLRCARRFVESVRKGKRFKAHRTLQFWFCDAATWLRRLPEYGGIAPPG